MAKLPHNIERRLIGDHQTFPYRGWTGAHGTLYWIARTSDRKGWVATPSPHAQRHDGEPASIHARSLRALGAQLEAV